MTRWMQLLGASSLLLCVVCAFLICIEQPVAAAFTLGITLILWVISIGISIRELLISVKALEVHLDTIERMKTLTATTGREGDIETIHHRNISSSRKSHGNRSNDGASGEPAKEQSSEKSATTFGSDHKRNSRKTAQKQNPEKSAEQPSENTGKRRRSSKKNTDKVTPASSDAPHPTDTASEVPKAEGSTTTTRNRSHGGRRRGGRGHGTTGSTDTSSETRTNTGGDTPHATAPAQVPASPEAKA